MILPGLISAVFYRRRPSSLQIALGLVFTVVASALLGYFQDAGTSRVWDNTIVAAVGGVVLYLVILAYLLYVYFPKRERSGSSQVAPATPRP